MLQDVDALMVFVYQLNYMPLQLLKLRLPNELLIFLAFL